MQIEEHGWDSPALGHGMILRVYGHDGRPILAFPPQDGRYLDFESFGMVDAVGGLIEAGRIRLVAVDGIDWQTWTNDSIPPHDRAVRHEAYDRYVATEVVPWVRDRTGWTTLWATGCSMGGYHAANLTFRHPDMIDGLVAISGLYQLSHFIGDAMDETIYFQTPLAYLPSLDDPWYLDRLRAARLCFVCGQGAWEDEMLADTRAIGDVLDARGIPAIIDLWGHDVDHDWPWWRRMLPYELERMGV